MKIPEQTKQALYYLIQTAQKEGVTIAGFAFSENPPSITNFGNCTDCGEIKLYEKLCEMAEDKRRAGLVQTETVQQPA